MSSVYLISSNSYRLIKEETEKIIKNNPCTSFDLNITSIEDVCEEASYFSLFDEKKYILVKNAHIFGTSKKKKIDDTDNKTNKKDDILLKYLENPNPNTIVIFTLYGKTDSKKKITKAIKERFDFIEIPDLKPKELQKKAEKHMKDQGFKLDSKTLYYINSSCQNNYDLVMNELEKIKLYYKKGCTVKYEDVINIVCQNIEDSNFKFIDAVMNKNIKESFKIYEDLKIQKVEPIMLLSMIAKEIRNTLLVKKMLNKNSKKEMMTKLKINYDFQIDKLINNSYSFKEEQLERLLINLCDLDFKIKSGKINKNLALEMFILNICK